MSISDDIEEAFLVHRVNPYHYLHENVRCLRIKLQIAEVLCWELFESTDRHWLVTCTTIRAALRAL